MNLLKGGILTLSHRPSYKTKCEESCENMSGKAKWTDKNYALYKVNDYIRNNNNSLIDVCKDNKWSHILTMCKHYCYDVKELCAELGYDYWELKGKNKPLNYYSDYNILKETISTFIDEYGYFPTIKELKYNFDVPPSTIQRFGGIERIKNDIEYMEDDLIDDSGFRNRSHYEYIVAQFLIHNNVSYTREQHPFPKPYDNLRSDFTFEQANGTIYHLEVWGYSSADANGKRSQTYIKRKSQKLELYKKYNINLISVENDIFGNTFETIQIKLSKLLSDVLGSDLKIIDHTFLTHPNKMRDQELFEEIMKISKRSSTLPKESDFTSDNKCLFLEALKRFGNYGKFAKHFGVATNSKRGYWNENTVLNRLFDIQQKYGYLPTSIEIRNNKMAKSDDLFIGIVDGIKNVFGNTINGYLTYYEKCIAENIKLGEKDNEYLNNLYNLKYFRKDSVTETDRQRAYDILCA